MTALNPYNEDLEDQITEVILKHTKVSRTEANAYVA
ncbi:hypothetical protein UACE39S_01676 [Ureibacillus acetophenoni]